MISLVQEPLSLLDFVTDANTSTETTLEAECVYEGLKISHLELPASKDRIDHCCDMMFLKLIILNKCDSDIFIDILEFVLLLFNFAWSYNLSV